jgi:predicted dehydrogenase
VETPVRFAAVGLNHFHIHALVDLLRHAGGELAGFYAKEDDLASAFMQKHPETPRAAEMSHILEDKTIEVIVSAAIPDERAAIGIEAMRHGKDVMMDKPGATTLQQLAELRRAALETGRIYSICYAERLDQRATVAAERLVRDGAIGKVVQTIGLGPHRAALHTRQAWFFQRERFGGILCDIGAHQFDQFLAFTNSRDATILCSQARNTSHPEYPELQDFGDCTLVGDSGVSGYLRVDWFTPDGLSAWGDGRLFVIGTEGSIEVRKYVDVDGRTGTDHLFLVNKNASHYIDCSTEPLLYGTHFLNDVRNRTETAMSQSHCFMATELALRAQELAEQKQ